MYECSFVSFFPTYTYRLNDKWLVPALRVSLALYLHYETKQHAEAIRTICCLTKFECELGSELKCLLLLVQPLG